MKEYSLYFFDFDGTLFDSRESLIEVYNAGFRYLGYEIDRDMAAHYMHMSLQATAEEAGVPLDKQQEWARLIVEALDSEAATKAIKPFYDVIEVLEYLKKKGKPISIVTGNTAEHVWNTLKEKGLDGYFDGVYSGNDTKPKPAPDPILAGLKKYPGIPKDEAVYIGDSLQDPECAKNAGIAGILIDRNGEYGDYKEPKITSLKELID